MYAFNALPVIKLAGTIAILIILPMYSLLDSNTTNALVAIRIFIRVSLEEIARNATTRVAGNKYKQLHLTTIAPVFL